MSRSRSTPEPLSLSTFRTQPGEYVRDVARGGKRYLLTKAGKPVALLIPVNALGGKLSEDD